MEIILIVVLIISMIISAKLVNGVMQLFMKLIGASAMRYNAGTRIFFILLFGVMIFGIIVSLVSQIFGIQLQ